MSEPRLTGWWIPEGEGIPLEVWERIRDELPDAIAAGKAVVMVGGITLRWYPAPDSLDAAWAEARAVAPEGTAIELFGPVGGRYAAQIHGDHWLPGRSAGGDTPAAALRALTAKLRDKAPDGKARSTPIESVPLLDPTDFFSGAPTVLPPGTIGRR